jgi:hypothetical protein
MAEKGRKGKRRGGGRGRAAHFIDAALDGFIRHQALLLWRDVHVMRERAGGDLAAAVAEAGFFGDKGAYEAVWKRHWTAAAAPAAGGPEDALFGAIEAATRAAVLEERQARLDAGDVAMEDTEDYNDFVRRTMGQLIADAGAESGNPR